MPTVDVYNKGSRQPEIITACRLPSRHRPHRIWFKSDAIGSVAVWEAGETMCPWFEPKATVTQLSPVLCRRSRTHPLVCPPLSTRSTSVIWICWRCSLIFTEKRVSVISGEHGAVLYGAGLRFNRLLAFIYSRFFSHPFLFLLLFSDSSLHFCPRFRFRVLISRPGQSSRPSLRGR